jgi:hypothetical protein
MAKFGPRAGAFVCRADRDARRCALRSAAFLKSGALAAAGAAGGVPLNGGHDLDHPVS